MIAAMMIYGPNGMGCFRFIIFSDKRNNPHTEPIKEAKKKVNATFFNPKTIPSKPNSFMSPAPIPPLLSRIMTANKKKAIPPPNSEVHHGFNGWMNRMITKSGRKNNNTLLGIIIYVTSVTKTIMSIDINNIAIISSNFRPIIT